VKEAWVFLDPWSKEMVTTALENGADALVLPPGFRESTQALGRIVTVAPDGDMKPGRDVFFETLATHEDEMRIAGLSSSAPVVVELPGDPAGDSGIPTERHAGTWRIIPLENLVARGGRILLSVHTREELDLAMGVMEKGVSGVVLHPQDPEELRELLVRVKTREEPVALQTAVVETVRPAGMGDRVCVDTCTLMQEGEGLLVGNSSGFLFLVQAETIPNPYAAPRPFRVNAGPVHAYVRVDRGKTRYLSELEAGDSVVIVRASGKAAPATVGRAKIERRPLVLLEASCGDEKGSILLQNAETIRLTSPDGRARSITELNPGDSVLAALEKRGRHFGMEVDETIWEK